MENKPVFIVDDFRTIVQAVSVKLLPDLKLIDPMITGVHYSHGHPKEILEELVNLSKGMQSKFNRFPLIALFQDFPERMGAAPGFYADVDLHLIIAMGTDQNYTAGDRYLKNFKPVLYPIYFAFLEAMKKSRLFEITNGSGVFAHTKIDRLFWGREGLYGSEGNKFDDKVDCIEIKDLKVRIKTQNC